MATDGWHTDRKVRKGTLGCRGVNKRQSGWKSHWIEIQFAASARRSDENVNNNHRSLIETAETDLMGMTKGIFMDWCAPSFARKNESVVFQLYDPQLAFRRWWEKVRVEKQLRGSRTKTVIMKLSDDNGDWQVTKQFFFVGGSQRSSFPRTDAHR